MGTILFLAIPCGLRSSVNARPFNARPFVEAMQERFGLLNHPCFLMTSFTAADFLHLNTFGEGLSDTDRWAVDRWIGLLDPPTRSSPVPSLFLIP